MTPMWDYLLTSHQEITHLAKARLSPDYPSQGGMLGGQSAPEPVPDGLDPREHCRRDDPL